MTRRYVKRTYFDVMSYHQTISVYLGRGSVTGRKTAQLVLMSHPPVVSKHVYLGRGSVTGRKTAQLVLMSHPPVVSKHVYLGRGSVTGRKTAQLVLMSHPPVVSKPVSWHFHVSTNINVIRKHNPHPTLSVICILCFHALVLNYSAKTTIVVANNSVNMLDKTVYFYFVLWCSKSMSFISFAATKQMFVLRSGFVCHK